MLFKNVKGAKVPKSVFDLSYEKKFTADMGNLVPIMHDEVVPGDVFKIGSEMVIRMQPLVAPVLHEINVDVHYFFVPYRIIWDEFEDFITGGADGTLAPTHPTWSTASTGAGSLWDYMGMPQGVTPTGFLPSSLPFRAYNLIYNEYYRDQTLQSEINIETSGLLLKRNWEKDYFTSCLPWQQRGVAPALPISGTLQALWPAAVGGAGQFTMYGNTTASPSVPWDTLTKEILENNTIDVSGASTFNVADLRLAFQMQRFLERNARAGSRYTEFLRAHFNVSPRDERLDRPEFIGGCRNPLIISEVLQTGESGTTPQGTMAGHGITVGKNFIGKYRVKEFGVIIGLMSIMPKPAYSQGVDRQWKKTTKYDYFFPEFANLSEQEVYRGELYANNVSGDNNTVFGFQGRFDEMRFKKNLICGQMDVGGTYDYWHLSRQFGSAPLLNSSFIECVPRKDIFAAPSEPGFIVNFGNVIRAVRPLPYMSNPGLIDH